MALPIGRRRCSATMRRAAFTVSLIVVVRSVALASRRAVSSMSITCLPTGGVDTRAPADAQARHPCLVEPKEADLVDATAKLTSKGRITLPTAVREALDLHEGDQVVFRIEGLRVVLLRTSDFRPPPAFDLAGSIPVPARRRGARWDEATNITRTARGRQAH